MPNFDTNVYADHRAFQRAMRQRDRNHRAWQREQREIRQRARYLALYGTETPTTEQKLARFCGPAAVASAFGITRDMAARILLMTRTHKNEGTTSVNEIAAAFGLTYTRVFDYKPTLHPTLATWLRENRCRNALVRVGGNRNGHFVHVKDGFVIEDNGVYSKKRRVTHAIFLDRLDTEPLTGSSREHFLDDRQHNTNPSTEITNMSVNTKAVKAMLAAGITASTHHAAIKAAYKAETGEKLGKAGYEAVKAALAKPAKATKAEPVALSTDEAMKRAKQVVAERKAAGETGWENVTRVIEAGADGKPVRVEIKCADPQKDRDGKSVCSKTREIASQDVFQVKRCSTCQDRAQQIYRNEVAKSKRAQARKATGKKGRKAA